MKKDTDILPGNIYHNVSSALVAVQKEFSLPEGMAPESMTLPLWAMKYFAMEVEGVQSPHTAEAKKRDLNNFMQWYFDANGHLMIEQWLPRDSQGFLNSLEQLGRAPTTVNRAFAVIRRFARWVNDQPDSPFRFGLPTRGIKELTVDEPEAKKLTQKEVNALFKAADMLTLTEKRKNSRPRRNRAILALLYYTGLRVSELCGLKRNQYNGTHLLNIHRKGKSRTKRFYVSIACRIHLDNYLETERSEDDPDGSAEWLLLPYRKQKPLTRIMVLHVLNHIAEEAGKHKNSKIHLHPHRLRHTFGSEVRAKTGSDNETARLLGHASNKYVGLYTRSTEAEREAVLEEIGNGRMKSSAPARADNSQRQSGKRESHSPTPQKKIEIEKPKPPTKRKTKLPPGERKQKTEMANILLGAGMSPKDTAQALGISVTTLYRWLPASEMPKRSGARWKSKRSPEERAKKILEERKAMAEKKENHSPTPPPQGIEDLKKTVKRINRRFQET